VNAPVLAVRDLTVGFEVPGGRLSAVDAVSITVGPGEIVGLVGESGCGKSTLANAVLGLLPASTQVSGSVTVEGEEVLGASEDRLRELRGDRASMIFQDPATSLDPTCPVGVQVAETIRAHRRVTRKQARERAIELMAEVGIPDARARFADPPHRFSGGMRQRVVIAAALANDPAVLIADEPTTALDVTIQAQILDLITALTRDHATGVLLISHDLGVIAQVADRVGVMYGGQLVEEAAAADLFAAPAHPYTRALLAALPTAASEPGKLNAIPGQVPDLAGELPGCRFADRCPLRRPECDERPVPVAVGATQVACWDVVARLASGEGGR
jgi:oligopeptide/dipeptide ABC transporter ATP-binding protein